MFPPEVLHTSGCGLTIYMLNSLKSDMYNSKNSTLTSYINCFWLWLNVRVRETCPRVLLEIKYWIESSVGHMKGGVTYFASC